MCMLWCRRGCYDKADANQTLHSAATAMGRIVTKARGEAVKADIAMTEQVGNEKTREALINATIDEFANNGYQGASVAAICKRAGFTRGAFYFHFPSKEALLQEAMRTVLLDFYDRVSLKGSPSDYLTRLLAQLVPRLDLGAVDNPPDSVRFFGSLPFHRMIAACDEFADVRRLFTSLENGAHQELTQMFGRQQAEGTVREDVTAKALGEVFIVLGIGMAAAAEIGFEFKPRTIKKTILQILAPPGGVPSVAGSTDEPRRASPSKSKPRQAVT